MAKEPRGEEIEIKKAREETHYGAKSKEEVMKESKTRWGKVTGRKDKDE